MSSHYQVDPYNALEALDQAQKLAFSPFAFQATCSMKDLGILKAIDEAGKSGIQLEQIAELTKISSYGISVLLDMGLTIGLVTCKDRHFKIARMGKVVLYDQMTDINLAFSQDVCYRALSYLTESVQNGAPEGLKELGDWPTIYPGLAKLPEKAKQAWHDFDHYYSDRAFPVTLPLVFREKPKTLCDIGGNTGKWSLECLRYNPEVQITLVDLPAQITRARQNIENAGFAERSSFIETDLLLKKPTLPEHADIYWMSQFLDCFSEQQIVSILSNIGRVMAPQSKIYIMELLWDEQTSHAARYSLNAISLYFTALANGDSRFYEKEKFLALIEQAGLKVDEQISGIGLGHTLLVCSR